MVTGIHVQSVIAVCINIFIHGVTGNSISSYGTAVSEKDIGRIVANNRGSSMKTISIELTDSEIAEIVLGRLWISQGEED